MTHLFRMSGLYILAVSPVNRILWQDSAFVYRLSSADRLLFQLCEPWCQPAMYSG